jgi:hypothetical protein
VLAATAAAGAELASVAGAKPVSVTPSAVAPASVAPALPLAGGTAG